jgi:hypothetical protein
MAAKKKPGTEVQAIEQQIAAQAASVGDSIGSAAGNKIKITQSKEFDIGGQKSRGPINLVLVDFNSQNKYWVKDFDPKNPAPPDCFSLTEPASLQGSNKNMFPSKNSPDNQDTEDMGCNRCPFNQFKSHKNGVGKACKNQRVMATLGPDSVDPEEPLLILEASPTALQGFDSYVRRLASKGLMPVSVITEVSFDPGNTYPSLQFKEVSMNGNLSAHYSRLTEAQEMLRAEPDLTRDVPAPQAPKGRTTKKKVASRRRAA